MISQSYHILFFNLLTHESLALRRILQERTESPEIACSWQEILCTIEPILFMIDSLCFLKMAEFCHFPFYVVALEVLSTSRWILKAFLS